MPEDVADLPVLYSPEAVAQALGLPSPHWLENEARHKRIPHTRFGRRLRFTREQVDQVIQIYTIHHRNLTQPPPNWNSRKTPATRDKPRRLQARTPAARVRNAPAIG
ncbi:helix-turn-helix domain-containing protein [Nocardia sp. NPDC050412]|uniref:helix-turn-helix domain-containing protein n=1 Tax=Nocardia sp. NPDC050412 TaxID=3364320 RepID=UPI0037BB06A8